MHFVLPILQILDIIQNISFIMTKLFKVPLFLEEPHHSRVWGFIWLIDFHGFISPISSFLAIMLFLGQLSTEDADIFIQCEEDTLELMQIIISGHFLYCAQVFKHLYQQLVLVSVDKADYLSKGLTECTGLNFYTMLLFR